MPACIIAISISMPHHGKDHPAIKLDLRPDRHGPRTQAARLSHPRPMDRQRPGPILVQHVEAATADHQKPTCTGWLLRYCQQRQLPGPALMRGNIELKVRRIAKHDAKLNGLPNRRGMCRFRGRNCISPFVILHADPARGGGAERYTRSILPPPCGAQAGMTLALDRLDFSIRSSSRGRLIHSKRRPRHACIGKYLRFLGPPRSTPARPPVRHRSCHVARAKLRHISPAPRASPPRATRVADARPRPDHARCRDGRQSSQSPPPSFRLR